jgi:hypothetical protein
MGITMAQRAAWLLAAVLVVTIPAGLSALPQP